MYQAVCVCVRLCGGARVAAATRSHGGAHTPRAVAAAAAAGGNATPSLSSQFTQLREQHVLRAM